MRAVLEARGRLDVIVNNAAAFQVKPVEEFTVDEFDEHVAVNVRAPYFLVQAALPALRSSSAPIVVNVSSAAAGMFRHGQTVYGLTKAALEHLTMNMAAELAPDRIRVVCSVRGRSPPRSTLRSRIPRNDCARSAPWSRSVVW